MEHTEGLYYAVFRYIFYNVFHTALRLLSTFFLKLSDISANIRSNSVIGTPRFRNKQLDLRIQYDTNSNCET